MVCECLRWVGEAIIQDLEYMKIIEDAALDRALTAEEHPNRPHSQLLLIEKGQLSMLGLQCS